MKTIITIDAGTQSLRAGVLTVKGDILFSASRDYSPVFSPGNRAEQDPATWNSALFETLKDVGDFLQSTQEAQPDCIAITSQRASVIPVDAEGNVLHNALMWQDKRARAECDWIESKISREELYHACGLRLDPYFSLPKMLWLRNHEPEIWAKTSKLVGVQDYLTFLLTGSMATDWSQACRTMLMDLSTFSWNEKLLELFEIDRNLLCDLIPPGGTAGGLTEQAAKRTGLPAGLPVLLCGGDQQCAALALGLFSPGTATANTGTGGFVLGYAEKPIFDKKQRILCSASAIPGRWIAEAGIYASGAMFSWAKNQLFEGSGEEGDPYARINQQVSEVPPGSNGVIVLPHFSGSAAPNWNPLAKGLIFNLGLGSTKGEISRAILEAIAGEIADNLELIAENCGKVQRLFVAGGLTRSPSYCQIMADSTQVNVIRRKNAEATVLGCLISACVSRGFYGDYETAFQAVMSGAEEEFKPDEALGRIYAQNREIKRAIYAALNAAKVYEMANQETV